MYRGRERGTETLQTPRIRGLPTLAKSRPRCSRELKFLVRCSHTASLRNTVAGDGAVWRPSPRRSPMSMALLPGLPRPARPRYALRAVGARPNGRSVRCAARAGRGNAALSLWEAVPAGGVRRQGQLPPIAFPPPSLPSRGAARHARRSSGRSLDVPCLGGAASAARPLCPALRAHRCDLHPNSTSATLIPAPPSPPIARSVQSMSGTDATVVTPVPLQGPGEASRVPAFPPLPTSPFSSRLRRLFSPAARPSCPLFHSRPDFAPFRAPPRGLRPLRRRVLFRRMRGRFVPHPPNPLAPRRRRGPHFSLFCSFAAAMSRPRAVRGISAQAGLARTLLLPTAPAAPLPALASPPRIGWLRCPRGAPLIALPPRVQPRASRRRGRTMAPCRAALIPLHRPRRATKRRLRSHQAQRRAAPRQQAVLRR